MRLLSEVGAPVASKVITSVGDRRCGAGAEWLTQVTSTVKVVPDGHRPGDVLHHGEGVADRPTCATRDCRERDRTERERHDEEDPGGRSHVPTPCKASLSWTTGDLTGKRHPRARTGPDPLQRVGAGPRREREAHEDHPRTQHRVDEQPDAGLGTPPHRPVGRPPHDAPFPCRAWLSRIAHHFVATAPWSDAAVLARCASRCCPP